MKTTVLAALLMTIPMSTTFAFDPVVGLSAREGAGGHGGDPYEIYAVAFPDSAKLETGIEKVTAKVIASRAPESLKNEILTELANLQRNNRFLFLDQIIIMGSTEGGNAPADLQRFIGLGAMTGGNKGDAVYFSRRSLQHSPDAFAQLLLHEIIHHVVKPGLSYDEVFVDELTVTIMQGRAFSRILQAALEWDIHFRPGFLSTAQVVDTIWTDRMPGEVRSHVVKQLTSAYGENLWNAPVYAVINYVGAQALKSLMAFDQTSVWRDTSEWEQGSLWVMVRFSRVLEAGGVGTLFVNRRGLSECKVRIPWHSLSQRCPTDQVRLFKDVIKF